MARASSTMREGIIRRNAVCNLNPWADEGIEVNASPGARVEHNTVLVEGKVPWSISIRFPTANARVWNNLSNRQVILRDGAKADLKANVGNAQRNWFVDAKRGDLRLGRADLPAIDAGVVIPDEQKSAGESPLSADRHPMRGRSSIGGQAMSRTEIPGVPVSPCPTRAVSKHAPPMRRFGRLVSAPRPESRRSARCLHGLKVGGAEVLAARLARQLRDSIGSFSSAWTSWALWVRNCATRAFRSGSWTGSLA